jgi:polysaccharide biosynthesis/export protein
MNRTQTISVLLRLLIISGLAIFSVSRLSAQSVASAASVIPLPVNDGTGTVTPENLPEGTTPIDSLSANNILHCDDLIRITVLHEDDLTTETHVTTAGSITFPLIGDVQVAGKTIGDAEEDIRARLDKDYLVNPHVTIAIVQYSKLWVTVLGQVQKPGNVAMPASGSLDLLGAIALAGGYGADADVEHVNVRRLVDGRESLLTVNAQDLARDPHAKPFLVQPNDAVTIPCAEKSVSVLSEVQSPGKN